MFVEAVGPIILHLLMPRSILIPCQGIKASVTKPNRFSIEMIECFSQHENT